ncbi:MAG: DUF1992 domain-containing protein [Thermodesulfobacteriota bacterium]
MQDDQLDKCRRAKLGKDMLKETVKAQYQNQLNENQARQSLRQPETLVDRRIKQAMAEGQFNDLPGAGRPLDLDSYYEAPEHLRTGYHLLKNAGYVPEEVRLKKEMELIKDRLKLCGTEQERRELNRQLCDVSQRFHFYLEYNRKFKKPLY